MCLSKYFNIIKGLDHYLKYHAQADSNLVSVGSGLELHDVIKLEHLIGIPIADELIGTLGQKSDKGTDRRETVLVNYTDLSVHREPVFSKAPVELRKVLVGGTC